MPPSKSHSKLSNFIEDTPEVIPPSTPSAPARSPSDRLREKIARDSYSSSTSRKEQQLKNSTNAASLSLTNRSGATVETINDEPCEAMPPDLIAIDFFDTNKNYEKKMTMIRGKSRASHEAPVSANIDKKVDKSVLIVAEDGRAQEGRGRHHRPSQVQQLSNNAVSSGARLMGARRLIPEGLSLSSKSKSVRNRDGRVGAFAVTPRASSRCHGESPTELPAAADEEQGRWMSVESSEQCSPPPPHGAIGFQTTPGGDGNGPSHATLHPFKSGAVGPDCKADEDIESTIVLVCGMKTYVFVGVVMVFSVLIIVIVAIAVGASMCRKASLGWPC